MAVRVICGDITKLEVDAVVNAANRTLRGGGGVDGAIHAAGGPAILAECEKIRADAFRDGLPTGRAVVTTAGRLPARWVIHTVGPIYDSDPDPARSLASCYSESLRVAREVGAASIAFPAISTGVFGYPVEEAARIAIGTTAGSTAQVKEIIHICFSIRDRDIYQAALEQWQNELA